MDEMLKKWNLHAHTTLAQVSRPCKQPFTVAQPHQASTDVKAVMNQGGSGLSAPGAHATVDYRKQATEQRIPTVITVAGSDSGGGAGIQADLKTFAACGVFGTSAITALTAQNTRGVSGIHAVPAEFIAKQLTAVLDDLPVTVVKTGMLASVEVSLTLSIIRFHKVQYELTPVIEALPVGIAN